MKIKRTISLLVCAFLICSFFASAVDADEIRAPETVYDYEGAPEIFYEDAPEEDYYADDDSVVAETVELYDSGVWTENISWELYNDGFLHVSGYGAFPEGISPWAQYYYNDIHIAEIEEGITYIGDNAFAQCFNLQYVYMPDSVEYISESAFVGCDFDGWLTFSCSADSYSYKYAIEHSIVIDGDTYYDLPIAEGSFNDISWTLWTDGSLFVTGNGDIPDYTYQFAPWYDYCDHIKTVNISDGIERIGEFAFQYCTNLHNVYIPNSVKEIAVSAFFDLDFEKMLIYCEENTAAESFAVKNSIPAEVTRYDTSGEIGDNITWTIKDGVLELSGKGKMEDYCYFNIRTDLVKKIVVNDGITSVGNDAFSYFLNVTEIKLADSIEEIGYNAFCMCQSLEKITLPKSLDSIGEYSFSECYSLKEVDFPEELEKIGKHAFAFCTSLETVQLLTDVERIDDGAFMDCEKLGEIFIPSKIKRLGSDIFEGCNNDLVIHGLKDSKIEEYAKENSLSFEEIPVIDMEEEPVTVPAIKEEIPRRELSEGEKVVSIIADNIILILCGLSALAAALIAVIILIKVKNVKKAKAAKSHDEDETKE